MTLVKTSKCIMTLVKTSKNCVQRHDFNTFMEIEFLVLNGMQHGSSRVVSENEEMKCGVWWSWSVHVQKRYLTKYLLTIDALKWFKQKGCYRDKYICCLSDLCNTSGEFQSHYSPKISQHSI